MKITVLKTFHDDRLGRRVEPSESITVAADRGRDLIRNGLAEEIVEDAKDDKKAKAPK